MSFCARREGLGPVSKLRDFDLTACFEDALFSSLCSVFLFVTFIRLITLNRRASLQRSTKSTYLLWLKEACLLLATAANLFILVVFLSFSRNHDRLEVLFATAQTLTMMASAILTYYEHGRTRISSTVLLLFFPVFLVLSAIRLRTIGTSTYIQGSIIFGLEVAIPSLVLLAYALECFGPEIKEQGIRLEEDEKESPLETANIYSRWSFGWITPLMRLGSKKFITEDDLDSLLESDTSIKLGQQLRTAMKKHPNSLWAALFRAYGKDYASAAGLKLIQDCLVFLQPQLLRWLLSFIASYQRSVSYGVSGPHPLQGFVIALLMFTAAITQSVILHQYFQLCYLTGMRVRGGLVTTVYRKALNLSSDERSKRATGDIVNLMSVDCSRLQDLCTYGLITVSGPLQIALAFVSLYNLLGWPAFVGVAIMVFSVPLNTAIARYLKRLQEEQMKNRDKRTRIMNEVLNNIKSIKLYAWEPAMIRKILSVRNDEELKMLRKIGITTAFNNTLWSGIPLLVSFSSFAIAALVRTSPMTSDVIFPALSLFMLLQFPLAMFAQITSNVIEGMVSVNRLKQFLGAEELQSDARKLIRPLYYLKNGDEVLSVRSGDFSWSKADTPTLTGIKFSVQRGELAGILGRVGSGKSSLLSAILGEMERTRGEVTITGTVAYVPQNPWIQSATVRENILFSHRYDEEFYNLVLDACALREDLALLQDGDMTEVGEKGITLSGGQRARIALARAVYARADLYLLDDVLSAVDAHVARHVFDQVIGPEGLLSSRARVLVTNTISFCSQFDKLSYLRGGHIVEHGSYIDLLANPESELAKLVSGHGGSTPRHASGSATPKVDNETALLSLSTPGSPEEKHDFTEKDIGEAFQEKLNRRRSFGKAMLAPDQAVPRKGEVTATARKEHSEQGRVKKEVYFNYIKAASIWGVILNFVCIILAQGGNILANLTLRAWGDANEDRAITNGVSKYLLIYGLLCLASTLFSAAGSLFIFVLCTLRSAKLLHDQMLAAVMRAPLSFFELTPIGRILNLFSRDVYTVDSILGRVIQGTLRTMSSVAGIVIVIGASFPLFLVSVPPLGYVYYIIMVYYLATSRELKRLDAVSKSPIFVWFSESLAGRSTIRGFSQEDIFILGSDKRVDRNQMCYFPSVSCNRWLALRLELIGALIIFITAMLSLWALVTTGVDAGLVGLVLSYGLSVTGALNWAVRSVSEVEQNIVSVERIMHYVGTEPEAPFERPEKQPNANWPTKGVIEFRDYSMRYRPELGLVLKSISFTIDGSEKVGVCGRTGAGKSSLLLALFRIIEPASGTIYVDGIDITELGLHDLRSSISIIPQEPQLFEGTLRENVDPTGLHDDASIWTALTQAYLKEYAESMGGLDASVREGGSSMSAGQRQLLCFARALLRKSKILVLDEATSAVDLETDRAIQEIIRGPTFADVTMFTIAHRLNTIIEYDRVLVLDAGQVAELDTPANLMSKKNSKFYSMALEAGLISTE